MNNLANNSEYAVIKNSLKAELELLKKETGYEVEVPRPDVELLNNIKLGKLFSFDFGNTNHASQVENGIRLQGVVFKNDERGNAGYFQDSSIFVIKNRPDLDPSKGSFVVECLVNPASPDGVIASSGSQKDGWAIFLENGVPGFVVGHNQHLQFVDGVSGVVNKWTHIVAVIENHQNVIKLFVNGKFIGQRKMLLPIQSIKFNDGDIYLGKDAGELIDPKGVSIHSYKGLIQSVRIYREKIDDSRLIELLK